MDNAESVKKEYGELLEKLTDPKLISDWEKFEELSKRKKELEKIVEKIKEAEEIDKQIQENKVILGSGEDSELSSLAEEELASLQIRKKKALAEFENLLKIGKESGPGAVIMEIRAGTGGQEAGIFVADLYRMYTKYAETRGWKHKIYDANPTELGGFKEIIFEVKGSDAFSEMKHEGGVHRVQRIPETEKAGRIHTSTASVAVLPKPKKTEMKINPGDLKIDVYKSSGPGGQYVNKRETAVRITHLPTGLVVASQTERNLLQNKENALAILEARLLEAKQKQELAKQEEKRKTQIGTAERAEKIRTYNFPQNRITDHRVKKSWHQLDKIINGELEPIIEALQEL